MASQGRLAAMLGQLGSHLCHLQIRGKINLQPVPLTHPARDGIDTATLKSGTRQNRLTTRGVGPRFQRNPFKGRAKMFAHIVRPIHRHTRIRRSKRCKRNAKRRQDLRPLPVRAQAPPAGTAQCQNSGIGMQILHTFGRIKLRPAFSQPRPAPACVERHAQRIQPCQPCPQQGGCFHCFGKHAPCCAGE